MRVGLVGCAMSHIKIYINLLNSDNKVLCVLEDDIEFVPNFCDKLKSVLEQDLDWDMIYLGHHLYPQFRNNQYTDKSKTPVLEKWDIKTSIQKSMGGTFGYLITKKGAEKMLDYINRHGMSKGIDTMQQSAISVMDVFIATHI